jgi:hypothetical protein
MILIEAAYVGQDMLCNYAYGLQFGLPEALKGKEMNW